jgi:hypothetical protein
MKSPEKVSLAVFLLIALCLARALNSPSTAAPVIVQISKSSANACPTCGAGYDINLCHANYCQLPAIAPSAGNP